MNPNHPEAIAAAERAENRRRQRDAMKLQIQEAQLSGVGFLQNEYVTLAFRTVDRKVIFSIAWRHPNDKHDKLTGRYYALCHLDNGQHVELRRTFKHVYKPDENDNVKTVRVLRNARDMVLDAFTAVYRTEPALVCFTRAQRKKQKHNAYLSELQNPDKMKEASQRLRRTGSVY